MSKWLAVMMLFSTVLCLAQSHPAAKPGDPPSKALMSSILAAWSTGDSAKAAPFYDKSPGNTFFDLAPLEYKGWSEYQAGAAQLMGELEYFKMTLRPDDATIHRVGNWSWATATFNADGRMKNGNKLSMVARWTAVWQKKGGKWLIVHEHVSAPWAPESESRHR